MLVLVILGVLALIIGLIFMMGEKNLKKFEALMNKTVLKGQDLSYKYNSLIGILLILLAAALFYISLTLKK